MIALQWLWKVARAVIIVSVGLGGFYAIIRLMQSAEKKYSRRKFLLGAFAGVSIISIILALNLLWNAML